MIYVDIRVTKKVIIDAYRGGDDIGSSASGIVEKDFNLELSKYIYDRLKSLGVPVSLTRDGDSTLSIDDRVNKIKSIYGEGNDVIVISNALTTGENGAEIVYALRNSNALSSRLANELNTAGLNVSKYYQRRLPSDTSKDYNQLIRDTANNESLIISLLITLPFERCCVIVAVFFVGNVPFSNSSFILCFSEIILSILAKWL